MGSPRKTARGSEAKVSEDKVAVALSDVMQVAMSTMDAADEVISKREKAVKAAEKAVTDALKAFEAAEDIATKAADIFAVLEVAEQKVNALLVGK